MRYLTIYEDLIEIDSVTWDYVRISVNLETGKIKILEFIEGI